MRVSAIRYIPINIFYLIEIRFFSTQIFPCEFYNMKSCKNCFTTNPTDFYETQASRYCRACFKEKYFVPGRSRLLAAKLKRGQCADCGAKVTPENAIMFDFDHLRDKKRTLSTMTTAPNSKFEEEVSKCDLVCANDHRLRTLSRGRTWVILGRPRHGIQPKSPPNEPQSP